MIGNGRQIFEPISGFDDEEITVYTGAFNDDNNSWPNGIGVTWYPSGNHYIGEVRNGYW